LCHTIVVFVAPALAFLLHSLVIMQIFDTFDGAPSA
jgi:hypothetical protein